MSVAPLFLGLDVHRDSVTVAVLPEAGTTPLRVDRLPNDPKRLQRYVQTLS